MNRLTHSLLSVLVLSLLFVQPVIGKEISMSSLLDDMTNLAAMAEFPDPPYVTRQFSSYDRASKSPADPKTWFANNDCGNYLRVEERAGRKEHVMADMQGPGAIVRIWSPNPGGTLRIYIDGNEKPAIEYPMAELLSGKHPLLPPPIAVSLSMGWNLYFPLPYAKSCKVTCDKGGQYYHVNYRTYPKGTEVKSFAMEQLEAAKAEVQKVARRLPSPENDRRSDDGFQSSMSVGSFVGGSGTAALSVAWRHKCGATIEPGKTETIARLSGPKAINSLSLSMPTRGRSNAEVETALRSLVLQMTFDGEQTVESPLGDFFGAAPGVNPFHSLPLWSHVTDSECWFDCDWVMPFKDKCEIRLVNFGRTTVQIDGHYGDAPWQWTDRSMHFHARWKGEFDVPTRPMQDWNYLNATGKGVFGGVAFMIDNPVKDWWGEGDEKIYVDGETFPSHFGTGTEDYYGFGWCCPKLFTHAYHSESRCDGPGNFGRTSLNRFHILDRIPFDKSFKFDMELWHWKDCKVNLALTAYYYALPGATDTFRPIKAEDLVIRPLPEMKVHKVAGAIEGEKMKILKSTGSPGPQEWDDDSGGAHLWWHGGQKPGDELQLGFDVPATGKYQVSGRFLKAVDYGVIQLAINGQPAGKPIDFFHRGVIHTDEMPLGTFDLRAGQNVLSAKVVGANPKAEKAYMFGLDYVILKK